MAKTAVKSGIGQVDQEFVCLDALRTARAAFLNDVVNHAYGHAEVLANQGKPAKEIKVEILRSENTFQIAEFYYLVQHFKLDDPERVGGFIDRHNADMAALKEDRSTMRRLSLSPQRIQEAVFSPEQKAKVVENATGGRLRLDQSDLGRLLSPVISPETCRKTVVALSEGGLIERRHIGQVLVISNGSLETYYKQHLSAIVAAIVTQGAD